MDIPLSWINEFVDIDLLLEDVAHTLTNLGLEVDSIRLIGLPMPAGARLESPTSGVKNGYRFSGLTWEKDKIVVARVDEVLPHPNADRLVLCRLFDGLQEHTVLTGAPNLFEFKGKGALERPLKVAYAREGSTLYDGHQPGLVLSTLKRMKIRGVESYSMICSEKELGISDEHEGVIILDDDAPEGTPLADYMGDAVFSLSILPNMIRCASVLGVARELSAATGKPLRQPQLKTSGFGEPIQGTVSIRITESEFNPRFVLGLVRGARPQTSPYRVQLRLKLAGMRPINSIVDATNYVMLELGEPLHAFDYDALVKRAGGKAPVIITRRAKQGEKLTTLDEVERRLDDFTVLVTDEAGPLSLAGVMGGLESEVTETTQNVLLEGASWNYINTRRTVSAQKLFSEAAFRFARGVHPALAELGVRACLERIAQWSGGQIAAGLVDEYPAPQEDPVVELSEEHIRRLLGISIPLEEAAAILTRLGFACEVKDSLLTAKTPPHRLDIASGADGRADLIEEIARVYGYDNIPAARLADELPPQRANSAEERERQLKDTLAALGLQEVVTYRLTSPEEEARLLPKGSPVPSLDYIELANPITPEKRVMRRSLLASVLGTLERNMRLRERLELFEIGPVFLPRKGGGLPEEPVRVVIALSGARHASCWDGRGNAAFDFFDLKGILESLLISLHVQARFAPAEHPAFHPGKCARLIAGDAELGVMGELHPLVAQNYDFGGAPVLAADLDVEALFNAVPAETRAQPISAYPPVIEDLAVVLPKATPAADVEACLRKAGGALLKDVRLFDIFQGAQIGEGKRSLAYRLTYQAPDRTLTDAESGALRAKLIRALEDELGGKVRTQ